MKKTLIILILIFSITTQVFASSIFKKEEKVEIDKTQPFFIKIYSDSYTDLEENFDKPELATNHQIHFYNKPFNDKQNKPSDNFFIFAKRSEEIDLFKNYVDTVELKSNHKIGRWDLSGSIYQETISGINQYHNYISFEPSYKLNDKFSLFGGVAHSLTDNHDQTKLGIKWTPVKFNRLEFKVSISNYSRQFYNYRNRLNFETSYKL